MNEIVWEIVVVSALIAANGVFAMAELSILTSKKHLLRKQARSGNRRARLALNLAEQPEKLLSSVQVGITGIGILTGVYSGATLSGLLTANLVRAGLPLSWAEGLGMAAVVTAITLVTLVFGELLPKQIAIAHPNRSALAIAPVLRLMERLFLPVVALLAWTVSGLGRILGVDPRASQRVSDEDILALVDDAQQSGTLEQGEQERIRRVLRFSDRSVSAMMTHRTQVEWLDIEDDPRTLAETVRRTPHSCYPVCRESLSDVLGVIRVKDLFRSPKGLAGIRELMVQPLYVPETVRAPALLEMFRASGAPMALVYDEYGSLQGLATLKDVLEALVGHIQEDASDGPSLVRREDGSWLADASIPLDELFERLGLETPEGEAVGHVKLLSGFLMHRLGRPPKEADHLDYAGCRFEVVDMDGLRIDKVLVTPPPGSSGASPQDVR
ncbi:hemolysin family protein [Fundidesulfovibrio butyratiphilus]